MNFFNTDCQTLKNSEEGELIIKKPLLKNKNFEIKKIKENEQVSASYSFPNNKENIIPKLLNSSSSYMRNYKKKLEHLEKNSKKSSCHLFNITNQFEKSSKFYLFVYDK